MAGKKLKRNRIQFMNADYDDFWREFSHAGMILSVVGIGIAALGNRFRLKQIDSFVGNTPEADDAINDITEMLKTAAK